MTFIFFFFGNICYSLKIFQGQHLFKLDWSIKLFALASPVLRLGWASLFFVNIEHEDEQDDEDEDEIVSHLPGGHLPPPKFGHLPPPNSDISHPPKKHLPGGQLPPPIFFLLLAHFSWLFRLTAHGGHQGWEGGGA